MKLLQISALSCMLFCTFSFSTIKAQVTIGSLDSPHEDALLDLKEDDSGFSRKGLLLPRVQLKGATDPSPLGNHVKGMFVYNTEYISSEFNEGIYYNDGAKWVKTSATGGSTTPTGSGFFYMPSIVLPTDVSAPEYNNIDETFTVDLYNIYSSQFKLTDTGNSVKNPGATTIPVPVNTALDYFVIYFDNNVFTDVALSNSGSLTYKLKTGYVITEKTYMNIVLKEK